MLVAHTAAAGTATAATAGSGIIRDSCRAGHLENVVVIYAAALHAGVIADGRRARHLKCATVIHTAAVGVGSVIGNAATGHDECGAAFYIHAAALGLSNVIGNAAAIHGECAGFDVHTAAAGAGTGVVARDAAVPKRKRAPAVNTAAGFAGLFACVVAMGDPADQRPAVGDGEVRVVLYLDDRNAAGRVVGNVIPVEAEVEGVTALDDERFCSLHALGQIHISGFGRGVIHNLACAIPRRPGERTAVCGVGAIALSADAVGVVMLDILYQL